MTTPSTGLRSGTRSLTLAIALPLLLAGITPRGATVRAEATVALTLREAKAIRSLATPG